MRPSQRLEIKVGLLIVTGVIATVVMVLMSDKISFESTYVISAFMDDAAGLRKNSSVTLSGIPIGKVDRILAAKDTRGSIRVEMKINKAFLVPEGSLLQMSTSGIFGDSSLAFAPPRGKAVEATLPTNGTAAVVATPGFLDTLTIQAKGIMGALTGILTDDTRDDVKRLIRRAADLADHGAAVAKNLDENQAQLTEIFEQLRGITKDLKGVSAALSEHAGSIAAKIDTTLGAIDARVESIAARADATLGSINNLAGHADQLLADHRSDIGLMLRKFRDISVHVANITSELDLGEGVIGQLLVNRDLAKDVNGIAIDLAVAADLINDHPETLVWGTTKALRDEYRARRERMKMKRSFAEGFGKKPETARAPAPAP
ncbi:MAG: MCE family protein [Planctomycetes bacterium]|nr:MCE family protein [Planctomycetota bacterium]